MNILEYCLHSWAIVALLALVADALFADPAKLPHPVCFIGRAYAMLEPLARRAGHPRLAGCICVLLVSLIAGSLAAGICGLGMPDIPKQISEPIGMEYAGSAGTSDVERRSADTSSAGTGSADGFEDRAGHDAGRSAGQWSLVVRGLGFALALYVCFAGLAMGTLQREAGVALEFLRAGNLEQARRAVGMLVSRETTDLEQYDLCRALAETVSENFNDALIAPFFWLMLAGPGGLWAYKAVSTADSMWGYLTPKWRDLGFFGARLDDILAFVPARLSALFLLLGAKVVPCAGTFPGWTMIARQARTMKSPNAGWPMTMAAWLHHASMGGPTRYFGEIIHKPELGPYVQPEKQKNATDAGAGDPKGGASVSSLAWTPEAVQALLRHVRVSGFLGGLCMWGTGLVVHCFFWG